LSKICQPHRIDGEHAQAFLRIDYEAVLVLLGELARGTDNLVDERRELHSLGIKF
jgi:hypothetical protein